MNTITYRAKAVVVGTGAGGAVAAATLAAAGIETLIFEEGKYYKPEDHGSVFDGFARMYMGAGSTLALGHPPISLTLGRAVGGTTAINSSTCFRPPEGKVAKWGGPAYDEFLPFIENVEARLSVTTLDEDLLGGNYRVVKRGAAHIGVEVKPLRHNVKDCKKLGRCQFGCPEGAKQSTDRTFIPDALESGATLHTGHFIDDVIIENGRAAGVRGAIIEGPDAGARFEARADAVILSMGALSGPAFLLERKLANGSGRVGRGLQIHPAARVVALMDEIVDGHIALPQGAYIDHWQDRGVKHEGIFIHPGLLIPMLPGAGMYLKELAAAYRRLSAFGAFVDDTSVGRVLPGHWGTRFTALYQLNRTDTGRLRFGIARLAEIYFAAGASRVFTACRFMPEVRNMDELRRFESARVKAADIEMGAFHPLGTCAMGHDPKKSVVDFSLKSHDIPNFYIMDGSVIPGSLGVNPQITIMSVTMRAATLLAEKMK